MAESNSPVPTETRHSVRDLLGDMADRIKNRAVEVAAKGGSPEDVEEAMTQEMAKWSCALHPEGLGWHWYNNENGEWDGQCDPGT